MRWLSRVFVLGILLAGLGVSFSLLELGGQENFDAAHWIGKSLPPNVRQSDVYWLAPNAPLRFSVHAYGTGVRLFAHLEVPVNMTQSLQGEAFALRYELNEGQKTVLKGEYIFQTHFPDWVPFNNTPVPPRFYSNVSHLPSSDRRLFLPLPKGAASRELILTWQSSPSKGCASRSPCNPTSLDSTNHLRIGIRLAVAEVRKKANTSVIWSRMSQKERETALSGHVFPPHLVTPGEVEAALLRRWAPVGPLGDDYQRSSLYQLVDVDRLPDPLKSSALVAIGEKQVSIPIDSGGLVLSLNFLDGSNSGTPIVHFFSDKGLPPRLLSLEKISQGWRWLGELPSGLLTVACAQPCGVRLTQGGETLVPRRHYVAAYRGGEPIEYALSSQARLPQALRVDLRHIAEAGPVSPNRSRIDLTLLDEQGQVLHQWAPGLEPELSPFQRLDNEQALRVSGSDSLYVIAPAAARRLVVKSDSGSLVTVYARVEQMPLFRQLPDQRLPWRGVAQRAPNWYLLRPMQESALHDAGRRVLIQWFYPPLKPPDELDEHYTWESLQPSGPKAGRDVLFPVTLRESPSDKALASLFTLIPASGSVQLRGAFPLAPVTPSLIYHRADPSPSKIALQLNGQAWLARTVAGRNGKLRLPGRASGVAELRYQGRGLWWMNHQLPSSAEVFRLRKAYRLSKPLSFKINKLNQAMVVGLNVFLPPGATSLTLDLSLSPKLKRPGVYRSYTVPKRRIQLGSMPLRSIVIGEEKRWQEPLFIAVPLGQDLPEGEYQLKLVLAENSAGREALVGGGYSLQNMESALKVYREFVDEK